MRKTRSGFWQFQKPEEGSAAQLEVFVFFYFFLYVIFGVATKWLRDIAGMNDIEILCLTTAGGVIVALLVILFGRWSKRFRSEAPPVKFSRFEFPREYLWIIPSGICTAFVIPTTTMMYTFGFSVMVAMVIMRASLIVGGRGIDALMNYERRHEDRIIEECTRRDLPLPPRKVKWEIKKILWQEEMAWLYAIAAIVILFFEAGEKDFEYLTQTTVKVTLALYIIPYTLRIYIMNRFRATGIKRDNKAFFAIEQISATATIILFTLGVLVWVGMNGGLNGMKVEHVYKVFEAEGVQGISMADRLLQVYHAFRYPSLAAFLFGLPFGASSFFSVFIFMRKGGNATANVTMNRLASLIAGTYATIAFWLCFGGKPPKVYELESVGLMFVSIALLGWAEYIRQKKTEKQTF